MRQYRSHILLLINTRKLQGKYAKDNDFFKNKICYLGFALNQVYVFISVLTGTHFILIMRTLYFAIIQLKIT